MQSKSEVYSCRKRRSPNGPSSSSSCPTLLWVNLNDVLLLPSKLFLFSEMSKLIFYNMTWYPKIFVLKKGVAFRIIWMGYLVNSSYLCLVYKSRCAMRTAQVLKMTCSCPRNPRRWIGRWSLGLSLAKVAGMQYNYKTFY
jgi:hypothetical protein